MLLQIFSSRGKFCASYLVSVSRGVRKQPPEEKRDKQEETSDGAIDTEVGDGTSVALCVCAHPLIVVLLTAVKTWFIVSISSKQTNVIAKGCHHQAKLLHYWSRPCGQARRITATG